jgi:hypothetical protein
MQRLVKIVLRSWLSIAALLVIAAVVVSPWFVADWLDEVGVLIYLFAVSPILVGAIVVGVRPFWIWIRS